MEKYSIIDLFKADLPLGTLVKTTIDDCDYEFIIGIDEDSNEQEKTLLTKGRRENWFEIIRTQQLLHAEFEVIGTDEKESIAYGDKVSVKWGGRRYTGTMLDRDENTLEFYVKLPNGSIESFDYDDITVFQVQD